MAQKWEYLVATSEHSLNPKIMALGEKYESWFEYGDKKYPVSKDSDPRRSLNLFLNELGEREWELISAEGGYYIFKRLKP